MDHAKIDLRVMEWGGGHGLDLDQDRYKWRAVVYAVMSLLVT